MGETDDASRIDAALETIEERIEEIESDSRYPADDEEPADVQANAYLALMQAEWRGELMGLRRAKQALQDEE